MGLISLEQSKLAYRADFVLYGAAAAMLATYVALTTPASQWPATAGLIAAGLMVWTLTEYLLHRFVLHGLLPFRDWHAEHHKRPTALICSPTIVTAALFVVTVYLPASWMFGQGGACAFTFGMVTGYLGYASMHHALHHWRGESAWFRSLKRQHALHHAGRAPLNYFGVTSLLWDRAFGTAAAGTTRRH